MKTISSVLLSPALVLSVSLAALAQRNMSPPPGSMDPETKTGQNGPLIERRIDLVEVEKEADVLARTAQTIPSDVVNVSKGMLPNDVIEKLKQIEKLSKRLRSELNP
jgi:hypothetical protein